MPDSAVQGAWPAPCIDGPIQWNVQVPGSKSATARALYLAAVADSPSRIRGALSSRDTHLMTAALSTLGAQITVGADTVTVTPWDVTAVSGSAEEPERTIDVGLAGTVMRFVPLLALLRPGVTHFFGDPEAEHRPLGPLLDLARQLGAQVTCHGREGFLPFSLTGVDPQATFPEELVVDASASSQFLSAALLVAPLLGLRDGKTHRVTTRGPVVSLPHVRMSVQALRECGISIEESTVPADVTREDAPQYSWLIHPGRPHGAERAIEPDLTNAGVFLAAGVLLGGSVRIHDWPAQTTQAGDAWRTLLSSLGARVTWDETTSELRLDAPYDPSQARGPRYAGQHWDLHALGELTPTAVALLLFADSASSVHGVAHIRGHETDRLAALAHEVRALGGTVDEHPDGLSITPTPLRAPADTTPLRAYADHRMATFAALVGLRVAGVSVDDIACTSKTLPGFADMWASLAQTARRTGVSNEEDPLNTEGGCSGPS